MDAPMQRRRSRGCARGSGGARGGRRGARSQGELTRNNDYSTHHVISSAPQVKVQGVAGSSLVEQSKIFKASKAQKRKHRMVLSVEEKYKLLALRESKQVARFLLPDAPERKQKRKVSPERVACPLLPGVPSIPPPPVRQPWHEESNTDVPPKEARPKPVGLTGPIRWPSPEPVPSSGIDTIECEPMGEVEANSAELEPAPSPQKVRNIVLSPSTGVKTMDQLSKNVVQDVEIEFIGFSTSSSAKETVGLTLPVEIASSSSQGFDLFEDVAAFEAWEERISRNPGSDVEDDDVDSQDTPRRRNALEFPMEDLPPDMINLLNEIDAREDRAVHDLVKDDCRLFEWSNDPNIFSGQREEFIGSAGPTFESAGMSPLDIFEKIWDNDIMGLIVTETNRYAHQILLPTMSPQARMRRWVDVSRGDMWTFFGILMLQGIIPLPVETEYWHPCLPYVKVGNFTDIMPIRKFLLIKKCLHFVDNTVLPTVSNDKKKLIKVWPIIDHLNKKFSSLYLPEQNIVIDESLLLWKGRLSFSQIIFTKAARVGIKSYELCESRTGYLWSMIVYTGRTDTRQPFTEQEADMHANEPEGATSKIVYNLVRPLLNKGHTLVMDNFYNSPLLSRMLKRQKTDTMGTLRVNRQFVPESLKSKTKTNTRTGEIAYSQTNDLSIIVWHDANMVTMISTYHKIEVGGQEKHGHYKYRPKVVLDYNLSMGGVDKKDQMIQAFPMERSRNTIWYKKLFRRLLNVSIHNAFVIYCHTRKISQRQFRVQLADEILKKYKAIPNIAPLAPMVPKGHFPIKASRARCKHCAARRKESRTVWACDTCKVALCVECFEGYHSF